MIVSEGFLERLKEQLSGFGPISVRRMFGGAGVFADRMMFALVIDDVLYLKTDSASRALFEAEGLAPFSYMKQGRRIDTSFFQAPEQLLDDEDELVAWSKRALSAADGASARRPASKNRTRRTPA